MEQANLTYAERLILNIDIIDEKLEDNGLEEEMIEKLQKCKNKLEFK